MQCMYMLFNQVFLHVSRMCYVLWPAPDEPVSFILNLLPSILQCWLGKRNPLHPDIAASKVLFGEMWHILELLWKMTIHCISTALSHLLFRVAFKHKYTSLTAEQGSKITSCCWVTCSIVCTCICGCVAEYLFQYVWNSYKSQAHVETFVFDEFTMNAINIKHTIVHWSGMVIDILTVSRMLMMTMTLMVTCWVWGSSPKKNRLVFKACH